MSQKSHFARNVALVMEGLVLVLSVLERSRIARFLSTKAILDLVVEVTDKFGAAAGHRLSTMIASIVAEPMIIVYIVAGLLTVINLLVFLIQKHRHKKKQALKKPPLKKQPLQR